MLLKLWRQLCDLKGLSESWSDAYSCFLSVASNESLAVISGIRYLHECRETSNKNDDLQEPYKPWGDADDVNNDEDEGVKCTPARPGHSNTIDEQALDAILQAQTPLGEDLHGRLAIEIAKRRKIFQNDTDQQYWQTSSTTCVGNATGDDIQKLMNWHLQLESDVSRMNLIQPGVGVGSAKEGTRGAVQLLNRSMLSTEARVESYGSTQPESTDRHLSPMDPSSLNQEQRQAYDIITWHLDQTLAGRNPAPLRMIVHGEGGTGKSKVLQTVTEAFKQQGCQSRLLKAAYTGVAASHIDGKTTHTIASLSLNARSSDTDITISEATKLKLEQMWEPYNYLALDEMGMIAKDFFALISQCTSIGKKQSGAGWSFGGINVILFGDFHQFPPVARPICNALYYMSNPQTDSIGSQVGRATYEEFNTVMILKEQRRITDPVWHNFLKHLRDGTIQDEHLNMLCTLIIGKKQDLDVDFEKEPWLDASLITPHHAVHSQWNTTALRKMCQEHGQQLFICSAEDTYKGRQLNIHKVCALESHRARRKGEQQHKGKDLPYRVELAVGMKVMMTDNVETDLDITNGARGKVVGIVLHPDEPPIASNQALVKLRYLPRYILIKLSHTKATQLEGLEEGMVPIEPISTSYRIKVHTKEGKALQCTINVKISPRVSQKRLRFGDDVGKREFIKFTKKYHQQLEEECASVGRVTVCAMSPPRLADIGVLLQQAEDATRD